MEKEIFLKDLQVVYGLIESRVNRINKLYSLIENSDAAEYKLLDKLLKICDLAATKQNKLAVLNKLINLREDMLTISLEGKNNIEQILAKVYKEVADFHLKQHEELLRDIEQKKLLNPFYRTLLFGVHEIGKALTLWQPKWTKHIINSINKTLLKEFGNDEKIVQFLNKNNLFDKNRDGSCADRSYSALVKDGLVYKNAPYAVVFTKEVKKVTVEIEKLILKLQNEYDDIYDAKEAYITYFITLKNAFCEKDEESVISSWQDVDTAWMNIKTPIQVAHPFEYYEDHYKKAVALEWDVRVQNPKNLNADLTKKRIKKMYKELFEKIDTYDKDKKIYEKSISSIEKTSIYIARPMLYYAAEFNGLFSAQVIPNDETVSKKVGKKIFAYADNVLDGIRAKPFMKIQNEVFGAEFVFKDRELTFKKPETWHKIYEYTTIGHEFGHILWIDEDTESEMNKSGVFKNIEEFKASAGGLCAFFKDSDEALLTYVISDIIKRSIGLIAWMKTGEVEPYYCECLIHLFGLFKSKVLSFDNKLRIDLGEENIKCLINWYFETYLDLAKQYLSKRDAKYFLDRFAKKEYGIYMPINKDVNNFVQYYWELYKNIGREIDTGDKIENWF